MDRKQAFARVQLWLSVSDLIKENPNYGHSHMLANFIWKLTDGKEIYTTGFIYDVWCELTGKK